jgi:hypothetical protein
MYIRSADGVDLQTLDLGNQNEKIAYMLVTVSCWFGYHSERFASWPHLLS